MSLCQLLAQQSLYYATQDQAYEELTRISNEDFGYDARSWECWGIQNNQFLPGWQGLDAVTRALGNGGDKEG